MRRFNSGAVLALLCLLLSCESGTTTYQIVNNMEQVISDSLPGLDGSLYDLVVFVYYGDDIVRQDYIEKIAPAGGTSDLIEVPENCNRVRVSFSSVPLESDLMNTSEGFRKFVARFDELESGMQNQIMINDSTFTKVTFNL